MMEVVPEAFATLIEMIVREGLEKNCTEMEPGRVEIRLQVRRDEQVPGGWAVHSRGSRVYTPKGEPDLDQRKIEWLSSGDTGISSEAIFAVFSGLDQKRADHNWPHDPADFGRCFRLLSRFPEWKDRLNEVAVAMPKWGPMIKAWPEIEVLYIAELAAVGQSAPQTYARIKQAEQEIQALKMDTFG